MRIEARCGDFEDMASRYAAFLSYSHSADQQAAVVQRALQRLG